MQKIWFVKDGKAMRKIDECRCVDKLFEVVQHLFPCLNRMLQRARDTDHIDVNCVDPLGRSGLLMAIDNENLEMVELLIEYRVETKDALLHAISEEYVEAVEVLLDHEETIHKKGEPHVSRLSLQILFKKAVLVNNQWLCRPFISGLDNNFLVF